MRSSLVILAQLEHLDPSAPIGKGSGLIFKDVLLIAGALLVLTAFLFLFARFYVRNRRRRHRSHRSESQAFEAATTPAPAGQTDSASPGSRHRRRRRRRRRDHRGRNPTLAETGGLPPPRPSAGSSRPPSV